MKWDPHTGEMERCNYSITKQNNIKLTNINLRLDPVTSVFYVSGK